MTGRQITFIAFCCIVALFFIGKTCKPSNGEISELDSIKRVNQYLELKHVEKDSIIRELLLSIEAKDLVIESREQEVARANKATNEIRKKYESIKPMRFSNNAQRDSLLSKLYPAGFHL